MAGAIPGSAGCTDFGGGIFGNSLTDELLQDIQPLDLQPGAQGEDYFVIRIVPPT